MLRTEKVQLCQGLVASESFSQLSEAHIKNSDICILLPASQNSASICTYQSTQAIILVYRQKSDEEPCRQSVIHTHKAKTFKSLLALEAFSQRFAALVARLNICERILSALSRRQSFFAGKVCARSAEHTC
eukprot:6187517-Pleurochrysis_carterae.AAC.3